MNGAKAASNEDKAASDAPKPLTVNPEISKNPPYFLHCRDNTCFPTPAKGQYMFFICSKERKSVRMAIIFRRDNDIKQIRELYRIMVFKTFVPFIGNQVRLE
mgnify:CR=1 FL=1